MIHLYIERSRGIIGRDRYRTGVKGTSVHPCRDLTTVREFLAKQKHSNCTSRVPKSLRSDAQFVVQRGACERKMQHAALLAGW